MTAKPASRRIQHGLIVGVMVVAAYNWGLHVQASTDQAVMSQHLSDDSIDNETVWQICTPRSTP